MANFNQELPRSANLNSTASTPAEQLKAIVETKHCLTSDLLNHRREVSEWVTRSSKHIREVDFTSISQEDLGVVFHALDEIFFGGKVNSTCESISCRPLAFRLSTRMTSTAGTTTMRSSRGGRQRYFEIAVATTPLFETFRLENMAQVGGVACHSRLEALGRIMEHEMIHLIEMLLWQTSSCSARRFQDIVRRIFGHTDPKHRMLTPREVARKKIGVVPGDKITFQHQGETLQGVVDRISKRATVLVATDDRKGRMFNDGKRYFKFYVPLTRLRVLKSSQ